MRWEHSKKLVTVKPLCLEDCPAAAYLHQAAFFKGWTAASLQETLEAPFTFGIQIQEKDVFVGYLIWRELGDVAEILTFVIASQSQQKGYGSALLHAVCKALCGRNVNTLFIEVAADNESALSFYRKHDFILLGTRPQYYARENNNHVGALTFQKNIV